MQEVEENIFDQEFGAKNKNCLCLDVQVRKLWGEGCWNERRLTGEQTRSVWTQTGRSGVFS